MIRFCSFIKCVDLHLPVIFLSPVTWCRTSIVVFRSGVTLPATLAYVPSWLPDILLPCYVFRHQCFGFYTLLHPSLLLYIIFCNKWRSVGTLLTFAVFQTSPWAILSNVSDAALYGNGDGSDGIGRGISVERKSGSSAGIVAVSGMGAGGKRGSAEKGM